MTTTAPLRNLVDEIPTAADEQLADKLRMLALRIMWEHPIFAAHLSIAAAGIAPAGTIDAQVSDFFANHLVDFSNQLSENNAEDLRRNRDDGRLTTNGLRIDGVGGELGRHLLKSATRTHA